MTTEIFMVGGAAAVHVVVPPGEYIIGQDGEADIQIPDESVSARHARLVVDRESVCIQDLDSENGTFVEGESAVGLTNIYDGQSAVLGSVSLRVRQSTDPESLGDGPRYVRGGMVAFGGMGAIHEARQSAMGRKVAMKVMLHSWNAASVKRFLDEARITGMLEHPNIVPVHEMGIDDEDQFFYTMKFVRGATLAEVIAALGIGNEESVQKFPLAALLTIFQKVCDAVAFAHSRGIFHRDLKPENIMIGDFGEVLVMDWGLAKESGFVSFDEAPDAGETPSPDEEAAGGTASLRTMEGSVLGTPTYMSPEQARGETSAVDHRSDIYSLGAVLHEILYLQPPVRGKNRERVIEKVAAGVRDAPEPRPLPHLPAQRPPASLEAVCQKAMAFESAQRYQQVTDLQADITAYQSGFATSAEGAGLAKHLMLFVKRNRGVSLAVAAGLILLLASSVLFTVNLVRERNKAEAALAVAEEKERQRQMADAGRLAAEGKISSADRAAQLERDRREAAEAREKEVNSDVEEQRRIVEETTRSRVEDARRFSRMARAAVAEGRPADALQLLSTAVDYAPDNADYLKNHGLALLALGRYADAAERFKRVLQLDSGAGVSDALAKAEELQAASAKGGGVTPGMTAAMERFLVGAGYPLYVRLADAAVEGRSRTAGAENSQEVAGAELILSRLGGIAEQSGWESSRLGDLGNGLFKLDLSGLELQSLPDLSATGVVDLDIADTAVADISPLRGLSLRRLDLAGTQVADLLPLRNMTELRELVCSEAVSDLSPLQGVPLQSLDVRGSRVENLEPLRDAQLKTLLAGRSKVFDLQPVVGQPIEELDVEVERLGDPKQVERMKNLTKLRLPRGTGPLDASAMPALREIFIPDLKPDGPMSGDAYRQLAELRRNAWEQHGGLLGQLGLKNFGPDRVVVREKGKTFDLDLRGTGIADLKPLANLPIHRLFVDTFGEFETGGLDLGPLGAHPTLRHLSLENAWVPSVEPLLRNKQLSSLVLSRTTADTLLLAKHPGLQRIGYKTGDDGLSPSGTKEEFFASRAGEQPSPPATGAKTKYVFAFDSAAEGTSGWIVDYGGKEDPVALWMADPRAEGGAGGGYISFYERRGNNIPGFFVASPAINGNQGDLLGGILEFRLRMGREVNEKEPKYESLHVELVDSSKKWVHVFDQKPSADWLHFSVPLSSAAWWRLNGAEGQFATDDDLRQTLKRLRQIRIKAEFATDHLDERTDLDDVILWKIGDESKKDAKPAVN